MDAANSIKQKDNCRHQIMVCAVVFFAWCVSGQLSNAQVARVVPQSGPQEIAYDYTTNNNTQAFAPVRWRIQNSLYRNGCVVQWTADAFTLQGNAARRADCDLRAVVEAGTRSARWEESTPYDASKISSGKESATVEVMSARRGNARIRLRLRFTPAPNTTLVGGNYQTTLTATITGI